MRVWDATNYCLLKEAYAPGAPPIGCAKFAPNGTHILSGAFDSTLRVWKTDESDPDVLTTVRSLQHPQYKNTNFCLPVTFTQDETAKKMIVTTSEDPSASIVMFCVSDKKNKALVLKGHKDTVLGLDCGRINGRNALISGGGVNDCSVKLWKQK